MIYPSASQRATDAADIDQGEGLVCTRRVCVDGKFFARQGQRLRVNGVTYGPFAPNAEGEPFPSPARVVADFQLMRAAGINSIRTYHLPPDWQLDLADEHGISVFIDVPWPKHLCFLDSPAAQKHARRAVRAAVVRGRRHDSVLAYSVCNEIPTNVIRWHGNHAVERFIQELVDVAKEADSECLTTYANFPPTEYLDLSFLDFVTFNVYLHDPGTFQRYLFRLQNVVGDKPLLLGELGMDTMRHGEEEQAQFLAGHLREAKLLGLAGAFVFSWTDDWHTGGFRIEDWAFGITTRERKPKPSYHALQTVFDRTPAELLSRRPRVSVVVCTYNGGQTLEQCVKSLLRLDYPDYEVIVVDDGSTDDTPEIVSRFSGMRAIRQPNRGLSYARNVGLHAATGSIVAYTDSDCYADPDWLTHLVDQLNRTSAAAVGGPNLSPPDGWLAACVAASPGQPTHVLESDQEAEHIPGCNMAFRKEALLAIDGFDYQYRKAGDDVDVCWRLQHAGYWITFAPAAFVWHHRRQTPRCYLKQQAGYGEAEALLRFKHPGRFNSRGDGKWRGVLYGPSLQGLCLGKPIVERGVFGTGLFQTVYQPGPSHWAMLPTTIEWHIAAVLMALVSFFFWDDARWCPLIMLAMSASIAVLQAAQAKLPREQDGFASRWLVAVLTYLQPLVRGWTRYRTRLFEYRRPELEPEYFHGRSRGLPWRGQLATAYWSEHAVERTEILELAIDYLEVRGWGKTIDSGWSDWDLEIFCHPWTIVQVTTAQEDHGSGKHLIRVRYRLRPRGYTRLLGILAGLMGLVALAWSPWLFMPAAALALAVAACWWAGTVRAAQAIAIIDAAARQLRLVSLRKPGTDRTNQESQPDIVLATTTEAQAG